MHWLLLVLAALPFSAWLILLLLPDRRWDMQPVGEDAESFLPDWPAVVAIVPARNEAADLPATLPALLGQSYPGPFRVVLVDDRSTDGSADVARFLARTCGAEDRLEVVRGSELPAGWVGKPWAMEQGLRHADLLSPPSRPEDAQWILLTDADILHGPRSLRRLVAESVNAGLALNSRMALLHCASAAERLLIPAFSYFFALLFPMRRVNDPERSVAAAAGGCMLLSREMAGALGGLTCIRDRIIDDVSLARAVKDAGGRIRLARSRSEVRSLRRYDTLADTWRMVRRSAFTQLRHSWLRLVACLAILSLVFAVPPALLLAALTGAIDPSRAPLIGALAASAWLLAALSYLPAIRAYRLSPAWALTLPLAGILYGGMTFDSALRHALGRSEAWRPPADPPVTAHGAPSAAKP